MNQNAKTKEQRKERKGTERERNKTEPYRLAGTLSLRRRPWTDQDQILSMSC